MTVSIGTSAFPTTLAEGLRKLHEATGDPSLAALEAEYLKEWRDSEGTTVDRARLESFRDRLSTRLMETYRATQSSLAFGLLYETNYRLFLAIIASRLRRFYFALDAQDVLQEVFFNIYRYPHRFHADKDQAFRNWASMIIRNTVYKATREKDREVTHELPDDEIEARADERVGSPLGSAIRDESEGLCSRTYLLYLRLYMAAYEQLSSRERLALEMVEIDGRPYKEAAQALDIRLENLKMVIFRARKKILRTLDRVMASAEAWRPSRAVAAGQKAVRPRVPVLRPLGQEVD
jgi:RNA polymerase sigma factor (sigma-70 family)